MGSPLCAALGGVTGNGRGRTVRSVLHCQVVRQDVHSDEGRVGPSDRRRVR